MRSSPRTRVDEVCPRAIDGTSTNEHISSRNHGETVMPSTSSRSSERSQSYNLRLASVRPVTGNEPVRPVPGFVAQAVVENEPARSVSARKVLNNQSTDSGT